MRRRLLALTSVSTLALALGACDSDDNSASSGVSDASTVDAAGDGAVSTDASPDASADGSAVDAGADAALTLDAGTDATVDASTDAGVDAADGSNTDAAIVDGSNSDAAIVDGSNSDAADSAVTGALAATQHVLLLSIDGMHQSDLARWVSANPTSALGALAASGVQFTNARTTTPSDSFPGMLALATGGTPKSTGVYYDDSYDRTLYPPGSGCAASPGTEILYDESLDFDDSQLQSGGIDEVNLPLMKDANNNCVPVYPHSFVKVNTIFEVVHAAGGRTAWSDKHPAYEILNGPSGLGLDDLYAPEQASSIANAPAGTVNGVNLLGSMAQCNSTNALATVTDYTSCQPAALAYDDVRVQAIINQIDGFTSDGARPAPATPTLFGMNFQSVSITEKIPVGGYTDALGTPSTLLTASIAHVDASIGKMVTELKAKGLFNSTLIIVTAKHGQSPINRSTLSTLAGTQPDGGGGGLGNASVKDPGSVIGAVDGGVDRVIGTPSAANPANGNTYDTDGHLTTDDVGILWIQHSTDPTAAATIVTALTSQATAIFANTLPPGTIFSSSITSGTALASIYGDPLSSDPVAAARAPDVFIQPNAGTIYSKSTSKVAEHGGGTLDDTAVPLLVSLPSIGIAPPVGTLVTTTQVAPTILKALRLSPTALQAVVKEGTTVLPNLF